MEAYYDKLVELIGYDAFTRKYDRLLRYLSKTPFEIMHEGDKERAQDGVELRAQLGFAVMANTPCSWLEMLLALAKRTEDQFMNVPGSGENNIHTWFMNMIFTLGLGDMDDEDFDRFVVEDILSSFTYRNYEPDGRGGLFYIANAPRDMREIPIWYQLMDYISSIYGL